MVSFKTRIMLRTGALCLFIGYADECKDSKNIRTKSCKIIASYRNMLYDMVFTYTILCRIDDFANVHTLHQIPLDKRLGDLHGI